MWSLQKDFGKDNKGGCCENFEKWFHGGGGV